jgi:cAMP-dependent protein kinase regulator
MLKGLSDYDILQLGDALKKKKYTKSQYIIKQGTEGNEFYILVSGQAVAIKGNKVVMEYKSYDYFGELALLNNQARAASIACVTNCEVLSLDRDSFNRLLGPLQSIMEKNASKYN